VQDFWAPEIHFVKGRYLVYFTARDASGVLCVGVAVSQSASPAGPYKDSGRPLLKNGTMGSIDASFFQYKDASGAQVALLYWKNDGNAVGQPTYIFVRRLTADGLEFYPGTTHTPLIVNNLPWEGQVVEGPWVIHRNGWYYLFYSGNGYDTMYKDGTCAYAVGVARARTPYGPFYKRGDPVLHSQHGNPLTGPGHCSVIQYHNINSHNSTAFYIVYHAWTLAQVGGFYPRHMLLDRVEWTADDWPTIDNGVPSHTPQPSP